MSQKDSKSGLQLQHQQGLLKVLETFGEINNNRHTQTNKLVVVVVVVVVLVLVTLACSSFFEGGGLKQVGKGHQEEGKAL